MPVVSFANESITRLRAPQVMDHGSLVSDWDNAAVATLTGWSLQPGASVEDLQNREAVRVDWTAYGPYDADVTAADKIRLPSGDYGVKDTVKVVCLEETAVALGLLYPGSTSATATGTTTISIPGGSKSNEKALVVDFKDDTVTKRYTIARAEVTGTGTISHKNSDMTMYEFTFTIYGDFKIITNNPALATA